MRRGIISIWVLQLLGLVFVVQAQNSLEEIYYDLIGGFIQSPGAPQSISPFTFCNWRFYAETRKQVQLEITLLNFTETYNHMVVFDGPDCMAPRIAAADRLPFRTPASWSNQLSALLMNDGDCLGDGFKSVYERVDRRTAKKPIGTNVESLMQNCGGNVYGTSGSIAVPEIGTGPKLCIWRIATDPGKLINLHITKLERGDWSWVRILNGGDCSAPTLKTYFRPQPSKPQMPETVVSTDNAMMILVMNSEAPFVKFRAEYTTAPVKISDLFKRGISRSGRNMGRPMIIGATCPGSVVVKEPEI